MNKNSNIETIEIDKKDLYANVLAKFDSNFIELIDIFGVDYPKRDCRFEIGYHFLDLKNNQRFLFKIQCTENDEIDSISSIVPSALWPEREVFDMYGVFFKNHPDHRRILTDYGFEGHPLRKDFPLVGFTQSYYDEISQRVQKEKVDLEIEYRDFKSEGPWERDFTTKEN